MTVRIYRSTDTSAPTLNGAAGSMITVLDAILVNGYGSMTAAGWAKEFSGTNKAAYRAASGNRLRLRVDDTGTLDARVVGYESMTDVDTGTNAFPTAAQFSGGLYWRKGNDTGTTRPWICAATATYFFFMCAASTTTYAAQWSTGIYKFGDFTSYVSGDAYNTLIDGNTGAGISTSNTFGASYIANLANATARGLYVARSYTGTGTSIIAQRISSSMCGMTANAATGTTHYGMGASVDSGGTASTGGIAYPNLPDNGLYMERIYINEGSTAHLRGYFPGLWTISYVTNTSTITVGDTWSGTGGLTGKTFEMREGTFGQVYRAAFETSDTW